MVFEELDYRIRLRELIPVVGIINYAARIEPFREHAEYNLDLMKKLVSATRRVRVLAFYNVLAIAGLMYGTAKGIESIIN